MGGWILLKENGNPRAIRKIDSIISNGKLFMQLEYPRETDLFKKAQDYTKDIVKVQKEIAEREAGW